MPLDEFVARVAEREGVSREAALDHAHAVFVTRGSHYSSDQGARLAPR
jgi:uncharacterized protein (DUF2267 family)